MYENNSYKAVKFTLINKKVYHPTSDWYTLYNMYRLLIILHLKPLHQILI